MENVLVVSNYSAGRKKAVMQKKFLHRFLMKNSKSFKFITIDETDTINIENFDTIIAVGGDGTVNKLIPLIINTDRALGIIPCGTANLLAAKLGIPENPKRALEIISEGSVCKADVLDINGNYSVLRCGFGYDSDIICKTPQSLKNRFGYFAYFIAGIIFALRLKKKEYQLNIDGNLVCKDASCLILANVSNMYRNLISLSDNSKTDDGIFDIFVLKTSNPFAFFVELIRIMFNIRKDNNRAEYIKAKSVKIENACRACHIDGEKKILKAEIVVKLLNNALNVYCK